MSRVAEANAPETARELCEYVTDRGFLLARTVVQDFFFTCNACAHPELNPYVLMMEAAEDWYRCDAGDLPRPPKFWSVLI